jgi:effector-associated domain 2 (EAD2)-containing protein
MGGVFINYRTADNPLGAAAVYESLARRFGAGRVFRDCVSLDAGCDYPAAIRGALLAADVVVSIIGPRWLLLVDERTGVRLIDRDHDWVRRELVMAFRHHIKVLPVLLKDTPEQAVMPRRQELPRNIGQLALVQAEQISQLRLGADLNRLATVLMRLVPALAVPPKSDSPAVAAIRREAVPKNGIFELIEALEMLPCMQTAAGRSFVVGQLPLNVATSIREHRHIRLHIAEIVQKCTIYGAMTHLLTLVSRIDRGSQSVTDLIAIFDRLR